MLNAYKINQKEVRIMAKQYVTVAGFWKYYGLIPFEEGQIVYLKKEPDNLHDAEAIAVHLPYVGTVGYLANSPRSVVRGTMSAGRLYDRIDANSVARVLFISESNIICELLSKKKSAYYLKRFDSYADELRQIVEEGFSSEENTGSDVPATEVNDGVIRITPLWKK